jgi:archaellum component FlaC
MTDILFSVLGAIFGVGGIFFGIVTALRNKKTDDTKEAKEDGIVLTELGYIKKGIDGIEQRLEKQENQYIDVVRHLTAVEESTKQAHKRIDKLEKYHTPN